MTIELGLYTFADVEPGVGLAQRLRDLVEEIELADQVGLDVFSRGPHGRLLLKGGKGREVATSGGKKLP